MRSSPLSILLATMALSAMATSCTTDQTPQPSSATSTTVQKSVTSFAFDPVEVGPEASITNKDAGCGSIGVFEATTASPTEVVIISTWANNCDVLSDLEIRITHIDGQPTEATGMIRSTMAGESTGPDNEVDVSLYRFDANGIISGRFGDNGEFWAVVDRPTEPRDG